MRSNKEQMWDNLMNWDTEFQVQIENMENMENMDAICRSSYCRCFWDSWVMSPHCIPSRPKKVAHYMSQ
jgi:hypothetical protein